MRPLLLVLAGACASVGTSLAVWTGIPLSPATYHEVIEDGLIRTNASEPVVNLAVATVLERNRRYVEVADEALEASHYHESAEAWFTKPDLFGTTNERVSRLVREQIDRNGRWLQIEVLRGADMATLVFVEHEDPTVVEQLAGQVGRELARNGVRAK